MKHKMHLGTSWQKTVTVELGMVQRFVDAYDSNDPLSRDAQAAKQAGLTGLLLPTPACATMGEFTKVVELLELKPKQVLHSKEYLQVFSPVCVGDELSISTTIRDLFEQQVSGNPMGFVTIDVVGTVKKDVRFEAQRILAIRGGFPRR
jgi:acyl dehydratase